MIAKDATVNAALEARKTSDGDPGPKAAEILALAVLQLHAMAVPQVIPADPKLVRLISAWRRQRDIVDGTINETEGRGLSHEDYKPADNRQRHVGSLAQQIWECAKAETWCGGPVNPLTLAVLAEIASTTKSARRLLYRATATGSWMRNHFRS